MTEAMTRMWAEFSRRERMLLIGAGALAAALLLWVMVQAAAAWRADLQHKHQQAVEREGRVAAKATWLAVPMPKGADGGGDMTAILAGLAQNVGLTLSRQEARGMDGANIAVAGKAPAVMAWLADLEQRGYGLDNLTVTPQADGTVALSMDVRRGRP